MAVNPSLIFYSVLLADAILDRLASGTIRVNLKGESMRKLRVLEFKCPYKKSLFCLFTIVTFWIVVSGVFEIIMGGAFE